MASALLFSARFLPSQNRDVTEAVVNLKSSFYSKLWHDQSLFRSKSNSIRIDHFVSVLGRKVQKRETDIPEPDYRIPVVLLGLACGLGYTKLAAAPAGLLGLLLSFQEVKVGEQLEDSGENVFIGGKTVGSISCTCSKSNE